MPQLSLKGMEEIKTIKMNTKQKGNLLEGIVEHLCSGIKNAKVSKNIKIIGKKSGEKREIDVLIEGMVGAFPVNIVVEAKNYNKPVGIEKVESLNSKLGDVGGNMGVLVCPNGFTKAARNLALSNGIKLYEVFDPKLGNKNLFIPLRCIMPNIAGFSYEVAHRTLGEFSISQDVSTWQFHVGSEILNARQLVWHAWNNGMIPQDAGEHVANFNAMTMSDIKNPKHLQYCEIKIHIKVVEKFYLKLVPASFLRESSSGKVYFNLDMHLASKENDMEKAGWKEFPSFEGMNRAADMKNQPKEINGLIIKTSYQIDINEIENN